MRAAFRTKSRQQPLHIPWQLCLDINLFFGNRVEKVQSAGVEGLSLHQFQAAAVEVIA